MAFVKPKYIELFFLLILAILWTPGNAKDCSFTKWDYYDNDMGCPAGKKEIYKEVEPNVEQSRRMCCVPETVAEKYKTHDATNCRATKCLSSTSSEICSTLYERYIGDNKLEYEEVMREPCTRESGGEGQGVVALCCQPNSTESLLVSTLGAELYEFPHQVKLKPSNCGGTIYNKRFVITASHCIVEKNGSVSDTLEMKAIMGTNIADVDTEDYVYKVIRVIPHEKYSSLEGQPEFLKGDDARTFNDIALLELDRDIQFAHNIKALEIAPKGFHPIFANKAVIVGWGKTYTLARPIHLQKANFEIRSDKGCFARRTGKWSQFNGMENQLLCVGGVMEGKWSSVAGEGDSGGPAICRGADEKIVLCGVTSFGAADDEACANDSVEENCLPSVYAEVAYFHDWIKKHAGPQDPQTFYRPYLYGKTVDPEQYPHQVQVTSQTGKSCGGTLVAPDVVVTAGHCVSKGYGSNKTYPGLKVTTWDGETFGVKRVAQLPGFKRDEETVDVEGLEQLPGFKRNGKPVNINQGDRVIITDNHYKNDLAVLKLEGKTSVNPKNLPALPPFGETYYRGKEIALSRNNSGPSQLMSREFKLLDLHECQARMDRMAKAKLNVKVDKNVLCGVEKYSGGSTCDRELGGGLITKGKDGKDVLYGVQIFRLCEFSIPNGFINMALYSNWVRDVMKQL